MQISTENGKVQNGITTKLLLYIAGYCRLSKDDGTNNESMSISTQKTMLKDYAKHNGFLECQFYVDM